MSENKAAAAPESDQPEGTVEPVLSPADASAVDGTGREDAARSPSPSPETTGYGGDGRSGVEIKITSREDDDGGDGGDAEQSLVTAGIGEDTLRRSGPAAISPDAPASRRARVRMTLRIPDDAVPGSHPAQSTPKPAPALADAVAVIRAMRVVSVGESSPPKPREDALPVRVAPLRSLEMTGALTAEDIVAETPGPAPIEPGAASPMELGADDMLGTEPVAPPTELSATAPGLVTPAKEAADEALELSDEDVTPEPADMDSQADQRSASAPIALAIDEPSVQPARARDEAVEIAPDELEAEPAEEDPGVDVSHRADEAPQAARPDAGNGAAVSEDRARSRHDEAARRAITPPSGRRGITKRQSPGAPAQAQEPAPKGEPKREPEEAVPEPRRRVRLWWEEIFTDDFMRSMGSLTSKQIAADVTFVEESLGVEKGGVMLDLGCGTGKHAVELASRGYTVVGYDLSLSMLAQAADEAQERGQKINLLQGDMREMAFEEMFDGIYSWHTSFGYFDSEKNVDVICRVHRALRHGGMFLLDIVNRDFVCSRLPSVAWFEGDGCVCMDDARLDAITSRLLVKRTLLLDDGRTREVEFSIRLYCLHEIGKILNDAGFKVVEVSGHPAMAGVFMGADSPRLIILAERR